ncbi:MAG: hypothetical protein ACYCUI_11525 [Vulcanimicrobiaceae bacterium]
MADHDALNGVPVLTCDGCSHLSKIDVPKEAAPGGPWFECRAVSPVPVVIAWQQTVAGVPPRPVFRALFPMVQAASPRCGLFT